jgi:hypothetical protein
MGAGWVLLAAIGAGIVTAVLAAVRSATHHSFVPVLEAAIVALVLLLAASFVAFHKMRMARNRAQDDLERQHTSIPAELPHRRRLLAVIENLVNDINTGHPCEYVDERPGTPPEYVRQMILGHWPDLAKCLDRWDNLVGERDEAHNNALALVNHEATGLAESDGWLPLQVRNRFYNYLSLGLNAPQLELRVAQNTQGWMSVYWWFFGAGYAIFSASPSEKNAEAVADQARERFERLFDEVLASEEFKCFRSLLTSVEECRKETRAQLQAVSLPEHVYGTCLAC